MLNKIMQSQSSSPPTALESDFTSESDVEQKYILPFLSHASYLNLPLAWIRTKEYLSPTELDKKAGKKHGYVPDYSIWLSGFPLIIIEAKSPDIDIEVGLREARLYAAEINKRYPPKINPIAFIVACNGREFAVSESDSETQVLISKLSDLQPGTAALNAIQGVIGKEALERHAKDIATHFQHRPFYRTSAFMGGQNALNYLLGVNEFGIELFPVLTKYFGNEAEEATDEIIRRAYVSSEEATTYGSVLETYLKDRLRLASKGAVQPIVTGRSNASGLTEAISQFSQNPSFYGRVQLIIGAVGAGKSTFTKRYYNFLIPKELRAATKWAFVDFNVLPPDLKNLRTWIADKFISSFSETNRVDVDSLKELEKIFGADLNKFEKGPAKLIREASENEYRRKKADALTQWVADKEKFVESIARYYSGDKHFGLVIVFDNVDRRSRDEQLKIFEAAQWFKDITRALVIVNLRDTTFEAHRDEPPLDAFINAVNFYIRPPRFAQVIRKRLELILENLAGEISPIQTYTLESGTKISYPASRLGEFLVGIYSSLFQSRTFQFAAALEALVAKNVRRALGMFADIIVAPHVLAGDLTGAALTEGSLRIPEARLIRALMRGRYKYYSSRSPYIKNILTADLDHNRPSNFLYADILEYLIINRKEKIDFHVEGYATVETVVKKMSQLGYDEQDAFKATTTLVGWGLIEPESLVLEQLHYEDAVRVHASGFIHMRYFAQTGEYLVGVTTDTAFSSREIAEDIGRIWTGPSRNDDISLSNKIRIAEKLSEYLKAEYERRCRRHAFYQELGRGGRALVSAAERSLDHLRNLKKRPR